MAKPRPPHRHNNSPKRRRLAGCGLALLAGGLMLFSAAGAQAEMRGYPVIKLQSLDKITARTETFEARVGSTVKFGPLFIKVQSCRKSDPIDEPESAAFLQVWEIDEKNEANWIFSGWMFASSPALSPMDHPVFDVWVLDCLSDQAPEKQQDELAQDEIAPAPQQDVGAAPADEPATAPEGAETDPGQSEEAAPPAQEAIETLDMGD